MKKLLLATTLTIFSTISAQAIPLEKSPLTINGIGPIKIGMTGKEVSKVLGKKIKFEKGGGDENCTIAEIQDAVLVTLVDNKVDMITVMESIENEYHYKHIVTAENVKIGDSETLLHKIYPQAIIEQHVYVPEGHYFKTKDKNDLGYVFETDGKNVIGIRAGHYPLVGYEEGCI